MLKCHEKTHDKTIHNPAYMKVIYKGGHDPMDLEVVRWCPICGAIVVDIDYDDRINAGGILPMQWPSYESK